MSAIPEPAYIPTGFRFPWPWCVMSVPALEFIASQVRSSTALRLLLILPSRLDWRDWRQLNQSELASTIHSYQANVSRGLKELLALGMLERRGAGPRQEWRLTQTLGWRGNVASFAAEAERRKKTKAASLDDWGDGTAA